MKKTILAATIALTSVLGVQAATLHTPDKAFLEAASAVGITQQNWDHGVLARTTMINAYRFTPHVELKTGDYSHDLGKASGLELSKLSGHDIDGEYPLDVIIRDRLNTDALVILKDGKLVDEYYWNGMDKDRTHLMMSITKSFTSMTLSQLVAEGKVDMNALITDYLPELKASPGFARATVQEVADMRSGIKIDFTPGMLWDERMTHVQEWYGKNQYPELESVLDFGATLNKQLDTEAGITYDYQCANTEMLGMIVQRVTGKSLAENMEARIWKKVGFENNAYLQSNSNGEAVGSGGLNAVPRDVAKMMDVLVNGGKNRAGEQIIAPEFINNLLEGNEEVRIAWANGSESKMAKDAWYKDQIRTFNIKGHKFLAFVGIHGQVTIGEPSTGIVLHFNGSQPEHQAKRTVAMTFLDVVPTLLSAAAQQ